MSPRAGGEPERRPAQPTDPGPRARRRSAGPAAARHGRTACRGSSRRLQASLAHQEFSRSPPPTPARPRRPRRAPLLPLDGAARGSQERVRPRAAPSGQVPGGLGRSRVARPRAAPAWWPQAACSRRSASLAATPTPSSAYLCVRPPRGPQSLATARSCAADPSDAPFPLARGLANRQGETGPCAHTAVWATSRAAASPSSGPQKYHRAHAAEHVL